MELALRNTSDRATLSFDSLRTLEIVPDAAAVARQNEVIERSMEVEQVNNEFTQGLATESLRALKAEMDAIETARTGLKAPILALGKKLDEVAKTSTSRLRSEFDRIAAMNNAYTALLLRAKQEEERKQAQELADLEAKRKALEQKTAQTADARAVAAFQTEQAHIEAQQAQVLTRPQTQVKVEGTKLRMKWIYEVTDTAALYKARPELCKKIEPSHTAIVAALERGDTDIPGITNAQKVPDVRV